MGTHLDAVSDSVNVKELERKAKERYSGPKYPEVSACMCKYFVISLLALRVASFPWPEL